MSFVVTRSRYVHTFSCITRLVSDMAFIARQPWHIHAFSCKMLSVTSLRDALIRPRYVHAFSYRLLSAWQMAFIVIIPRHTHTHTHTHTHRLFALNYTSVWFFRNILTPRMPENVTLIDKLTKAQGKFLRKTCTLNIYEIPRLLIPKSITVFTARHWTQYWARSIQSTVFFLNIHLTEVSTGVSTDSHRFFIGI